MGQSRVSEEVLDRDRAAMQVPTAIEARERLLGTRHVPEAGHAIWPCLTGKAGVLEVDLTSGVGRQLACTGFARRQNRHGRMLTWLCRSVTPTPSQDFVSVGQA